MYHGAWAGSTATKNAARADPSGAFSSDC